MPKLTYLVAAFLLTLIFLFYCGCTTESIAPAPTPTPIPTPNPSQLPPQDTTPPQITVTSSITDLTGGKNEITFRWKANDNISATNMLTYSYYLKGYNADYSPFKTDTYATYKDLPAGSYAFYVKSQDEAGNVGLATVTIEVTAASTMPKVKDGQIPINSSFLLLSNSEVSHIAVSSYGDIIYVLDSINAKLYKSEHGGYGWANISAGISGTPTWDAMAIAPDDHNIIAVVTDNGTEVYLSVDGGINFFSTNLTSRINFGERIKCIAISSGYGNNTHELAIGTSTNNGNGKVWISIAGLPGAWQDCSTSASGWLRTLPVASGVDVFTIKYSPSFSSDKTLLAIVASGPTSNAGDTFLYIGIRDLAKTTITWNSIAGYPVEICQPGQDTPGTPLTYTDLALPADYMGSIISQRHIYACWSNKPAGASIAGSNDDIYHIDDTICYRLQARPYIICSISHYGPFNNGKLLAGAAKSETVPSAPGIQIYCTFNPQSTTPYWQQSQKPPTGTNNAQVAWSSDGKTAYCGTGTVGGEAHDQSAFSRSTDNGLTWNQTGFIDN